MSRLERRTGRDTVAAEWTAYPPEGVLFGELALLSSNEKVVAYSVFRKLSDLYLIEGLR